MNLTLEVGAGRELEKRGNVDTSNISRESSQVGIETLVAIYLRIKYNKIHYGSKIKM